MPDDTFSCNTRVRRCYGEIFREKCIIVVQRRDGQRGDREEARRGRNEVDDASSVPYQLRNRSVVTAKSHLKTYLSLGTFHLHVHDLDNRNQTTCVFEQVHDELSEIERERENSSQQVIFPREQQSVLRFTTGGTEDSSPGWRLTLIAKLDILTATSGRTEWRCPRVAERMRELDTESPVVWPAWCYTGESNDRSMM